MSSAFYSRNNSYSRSYNAECAESEDRYPLTRAAAHLGLSVASFKKGLDYAGIGTSEWHHVGKYANRVDYYDVSDSSDIVMSAKFWKGATTRANKTHCDAMRIQALRTQATINIKDRLYTAPRNFSSHTFGSDMTAKFHPLFLKDICIYLGSRNGIATKSFPHRESGTQCVRYGSHTEYSRWECTHYGAMRERYYDSPVTCADTAYIQVFSLSPAGCAAVVNQVRTAKIARYAAFKGNFGNTVKYSFSVENVKKILNRIVRRVVHCNSLSDCSLADWTTAAKIMQNLYGWDFTVTDGRVSIQKSTAQVA